VSRLQIRTHRDLGTRAEWPLCVAACLVAAVICFSGLGAVPLMQPDEGRNAEVAREMLVTGSWLVPTLEGHPYLDKPAAYFDAVAVSLAVFGVNEWGARMPSAVSGLLILAMVYAFARRVYGSATAALAVIVVATSPMVLAFSRIVIMDVTLAACTVGAICAAFVAEEGERPDRRWHMASAVCVGAGMLVKGPVGALVPAAVLVVFFLIDRRPRALLRVFSPVNVVIVLAMFVPWLVALVRAHPEFLRYGVVEETLSRFFTPAFNRGQPFWYYGPVMVEATFPWTLLAVPMAYAALTARERWTRADRLLVVWTIVVVVFFSLSRTKQPGYVLTGAVAAGVLVGRGLGYAWATRDGRAARLVARTALGLAAAAAVAAAWLVLAVARGAANAASLSAMTEEARSIWRVWPSVLGVAAAIAVLGTIAFASRRVAPAVAAFALFPVGLVTLGLPAAVGFARVRSAVPLAAQLVSLPAGAEIACVHSYPEGLSFYLGRTLTLISNDGEPLRSNFIVYALKKSAERPATIVADADLPRWLAARSGPTTLIALDRDRGKLEAALGPGAAIADVPGGWIVGATGARAGR
jgi:4-amino-4-deoxy-L-arabinose transferase-like glycosyltransferase